MRKRTERAASRAGGQSEANVASSGKGIEFPHGTPVYVVTAPSTQLEERVSSELCDYLGKVTKIAPRIVKGLPEVPDGKPCLMLVNANVDSPVELKIPGKHPEAFQLITADAHGHQMVVAAGNTDKGLKRAVQRLIILSDQQPWGLLIKPTCLAESPWISHREYTPCVWDPFSVRGMFTNPYADKRLDIYKFSKGQLSKYVDMYDWFGFSGAQLLEVAYTYNSFGSVEAFHDWQKTMMSLLRENGQEVSVWVWAAQFTGYGWKDPSVVYSPQDGKTAFEDTDVRRSFEKYYDYYAELAPYADRFIAHFYDPGMLSEWDDVADYAHLLESKLKVKNPKLEMGIDCWAASGEYLIALANKGFKDYLMLPVAYPQKFPGDSREKFHEEAKKLGVRLGIWGWYTTEYETDQFASMFVNAMLLKDFYTKMRNGALKVKPVEYWSEMEASHIANIYTMYASAQLLWNPDRDPHEILAEITDIIWGPSNGPKVLRTLELIQDVRTGPNWSTYWWTLPTRRLGTENPEEDLKRAEECLSALQNMKTDPDFVVKIPLPYEPEVLVEVMLPHLEQIKLYSQFRIKIDNLRQAAANGTKKEELEKMLAEAWQPIPEFNTWVGVFGSFELHEQKKTMLAVAKEYGLSFEDPGWFRWLEADRLLQLFRARQSYSKVCVELAPNELKEFWWPLEFQQDRFDLLSSQDAITKQEDGKYILSDWTYWAAK